MHTDCILDDVDASDTVVIAKRRFPEVITGRAGYFHQRRVPMWWDYSSLQHASSHAVIGIYGSDDLSVDRPVRFPPRIQYIYDAAREVSISSYYIFIHFIARAASGPIYCGGNI